MEASALVYITLIAVTLILGAYVHSGSYLALNYRVGTREYERSRVARVAVFVLLTAVSACRIAVGNDYWVYRFNFRLIAQDRHVASESGFNAIVKLMQDIFGYDNYLPIFALFSILTCAFMCLALRDQGECYIFSLFLLLTGGYYFNSLNSVRYYLALAIALYSMKHVLRGNYIRFIIYILIGALFHKSILLVIPVYILADILSRVKLRAWMGVVAGAVLLSLIFCQGLYREIIFKIYPFYEGTDFDTGNISYANIAKCVCVLCLCALFYKNIVSRDRALRFYMMLNLFALVVYMCGGFIPETSRIGYYMIISQIFLLPGVCIRIGEKKLRIAAIAVVCAAFTIYFAILLKGMYATNIRLLPYLNWIFD